MFWYDTTTNLFALITVRRGDWLDICPVGAPECDLSISVSQSPTPTPINDGEIAFETYRDGNAEIYVMNADGTHPHNLTNSPVSSEFALVVA
ncbi:MAG: hypothetical protein U0670_01765 [Anaerolineae bacterium]